MNKKLIVAPRRFSNAIVAMVGVGLLVALAFSFNALFSSRSQQAPQVANRQKSPISQEILAAPTVAQADSTTGWKTYKDPVYSYTLQYPPNLFLYPTSTEGLGGTAQLFSYARDTYPTKERPLPRTKIKVEILVRENPRRLTPLQWLESYPNNISYQVHDSARNIIVDGKSGLEFINKRGDYSWLELYVTHEDNFYTFLVSPSDSDLLPIFRAVLNTFQFPH